MNRCRDHHGNRLFVVRVSSARPHDHGSPVTVLKTKGWWPVYSLCESFGV